MIPEPQHPNSLFIEKTATFRIGGPRLFIIMLPTINLHRQPRLGAIKIEHITIHRMLPPELAATQLPPPQMPPQQPLRISQIAAQITRRVQQGIGDRGWRPGIWMTFIGHKKTSQSMDERIIYRAGTARGKR
ncbi:hypothetical protein GSUB_13140 [Geoalkalibacter subterraneus]|uniref:Uncharacterized protein n=1 Tax=Geoalkalibacter subterraneus TaxID=483547 RepID=A0A0B5FUM4_9BACT|nr:hypothetical protein [Geoalkalibacter subterraneus]AJF07316.1 hypothetical protein GSUB_13140 [Geoalkalibacter subterraneus]